MNEKYFPNNEDVNEFLQDSISDENEYFDEVKEDISPIN
jgi:hypothetical protein